MVDAEADVKVITEAEATRLGRAIAPTGKVFAAADRSMLGVLGKKIRLTSVRGQSKEGVAYVLKGARHNLLRKPEIRIFGLVQSVCSVKEDVENQHPALFKGLGVLPDAFTIRLKSQHSSVPTRGKEAACGAEESY